MAKWMTRLGIYILVIVIYILIARKLTEISARGSQFFFELPILIFCYIIFDRLQRNKWVGFVNFSLLTIVVYSSFDLFYTMLRRFPRYSDFDTLTTLFEVLPAYLVVLIIGFSIAWILSVIINLKLRPLNWFVLNLVFGAITLNFIFNPPISLAKLTQKLAPKDEFAVIDTVQHYGRLFYMINEKSKLKNAHRLINNQTISNEKVIKNTRITITSPRNIYIIVLESFIDVSLFRNLEIKPNLSQLELKLRIDNLQSASISPSFGGGTANAEFEVLCGSPVLSQFHTLEFEVLTGSETSCLPSILAKSGYKTIATHPYKGSTFNRQRAYRSLGFQESLFSDFPKNGLMMNDMDDIWLFDGSLYKQNLAKIKQLLTRDQPYLFYTLTAGGIIHSN